MSLGMMLQGIVYSWQTQESLAGLQMLLNVKSGPSQGGIK